MTPNIYFAYSIRRDYNGLAALAPAEVPEKKRRTTRACDACSVRKTRCDKNRPCGHCINNNLECTELRQRKKSGPKNLRKKTIATIQSLLMESEKGSTVSETETKPGTASTSGPEPSISGASPAKDSGVSGSPSGNTSGNTAGNAPGSTGASGTSSVSGSSALPYQPDSRFMAFQIPDMDAVASHVASLPPVVVEAASMFTVGTFCSAADAIAVASSVSDSGMGNLFRRLAAASYVLVVLTVAELGDFDFDLALGEDVKLSNTTSLNANVNGDILSMNSLSDNIMSLNALFADRLDGLDALGALDHNASPNQTVNLNANRNLALHHNTRSLRLQLHAHVSALFGECTCIHGFLPSPLPFDTDYYFALLELHMYAVSTMGHIPPREYVHLRSAVMHWWLLQKFHGEEFLVRELGSALGVWQLHAVLFSPEPAFRLSGVERIPFRMGNNTMAHSQSMTQGQSYESEIGCGSDIGLRSDVSNITDNVSGNFLGFAGPCSVFTAYLNMLQAFNEALGLRRVPEPYTWQYMTDPADLSQFPEVKRKIHGCFPVHTSSVSRILAFMLVLKAIQVCLNGMSRIQVADELMELVVEVNAVLAPMSADLRVYVEVLKLVPQMLELLRAYLHVTVEDQLPPPVLDALLQLLSFVLFYASHPFEYSDPILSGWFGRLIGPHNAYIDTLVDEAVN